MTYRIYGCTRPGKVDGRLGDVLRVLTSEWREFPDIVHALEGAPSLSTRVNPAGRREAVRAALRKLAEAGRIEFKRSDDGRRCWMVRLRMPVNVGRLDAGRGERGSHNSH